MTAVASTRRPARPAARHGSGGRRGSSSSPPAVTVVLLILVIGSVALHRVATREALDDARVMTDALAHGVIVPELSSAVLSGNATRSRGSTALSASACCSTRWSASRSGAVAASSCTRTRAR